MWRCSGIPLALTLSCAPAMSLLQCPRQCRHLSSGFRPLRASGRTGDGTEGNLKMTKSDIH
ncbi:unnamed protein product [Staurois parvus]|uniref:Uncharacterized protein n=1 Tax=Staurois parvus TaxID=386267 RepID=A0ABN9C025_9NEOB|nr:unnamed protein product [Staurois parvus]